MNWKKLDPTTLDRDELLALVINMRTELNQIERPHNKEIRSLKVQLANEKRKIKLVYKKYKAWRIKHSRRLSVTERSK
jgi:hypothetical protein